MTIGTAFVDLSAAYDTVNHRLLIQILLITTQDSTLCRVIENLLSNRRLYVELNSVLSSWILQKNGLPHGSVLSRTLFNISNKNKNIKLFIHTYKQLYTPMISFIYTDDMCITAQYITF